MVDVLQDQRGAKIATPLGADKLVLRTLTFDEKLSADFSGTVDVLSKDFNVDARALLGQQATVELETTGAPRYFNAIIIGFQFRGAIGRHAAYTIQLAPWMHFLTLRQDCRVFKDKTAPNIIKEVIEGAGHSDKLDASNITDQYQSREFCVQYNESDANFIHRLMEQEGITSYYKHENGKHTLVLSDKNDKFDNFPGCETLKYYPEDAQRRAEGEHVFSWQWGNSVSSGAHATSDYDFKTPRKDMLVTSSVPDKHANADREVFTWPGKYIEPTDGERYNKIRREQAQVSREIARAGSNSRSISAGHVFNLANFPRKEINKSHLILSVTHSFHASDYESVTGGGGGMPIYTNSFTCSDPNLLYRPNEGIRHPRILGPQTAVVIGPEEGEEEIWTDEHGRIMVQFHWDRYKGGSCWIRVAQKWAGPEWGFQHIPRVGQEVLVEFLDGDPDRPLVTGAVYNGDNKPPFSLPENKTQSGMRSNSTKDATGANQILFEDMKDKENLFVHAQKDFTQRVLNTRTARVDSHDVYSVGGNRAVEVSKNQKHEVGGSMNITVGGTGVGAMALMGSLAGLSSQTAGLLKKAGKMGGGAAVGGFAATLASSALGFLSVGGLGKRKGVVKGKNPIADAGRDLITSGQGVGDAAAGLFPMPGVMNTVVGAFKSNTVGVASVEQVGVAKVTNVGAAEITNVGKEQHITVGKTQKTYVGELQHTTVGKTIRTEVVELYDLVSKDKFLGRAKTWTINANDKIVLTAPGGKIEINKKGIKIEGKKIDIKGKKINFSKSGSGKKTDLGFAEECPHKK